MPATTARIPLAVSNASRDSSHSKDVWSINVFLDNSYVRKRPGLYIDTYGGTGPGQGLFVWGTNRVWIRNDTLRVQDTEYAL